LTFDPDALDRLWLAHYVPEFIAAERKRYVPLEWLCGVLGGRCQVTAVPVGPQCPDGFTEAFYARPEMFLAEDVRRAQSGWGFVGPDVEARAVRHLAADLETGEWQTRFGHFRTLPEFDGALRLVVSVPD
jgi:hypothetical protein